MLFFKMSSLTEEVINVSNNLTHVEIENDFSKIGRLYKNDWYDEEGPDPFDLFRSILEGIERLERVPGLQKLDPDEQVLFDKFFEMFSNCPVCGVPNSKLYLKRFFTSDDPDKKALKNQLLPFLDRQDEFDKYTKMGIPCCGCFHQVFTVKHNPVIRFERADPERQQRLERWQNRCREHTNKKARQRDFLKNEEIQLKYNALVPHELSVIRSIQQRINEADDIFSKRFKVRNGHVVELRLTYCALSSMYEEAQSLLFLEFLDLSNNIFYEVPEGLLNFPSLKTVSLANNPLNDISDLFLNIPSLYFI